MSNTLVYGLLITFSSTCYHADKVTSFICHFTTRGCIIKYKLSPFRATHTHMEECIQTVSLICVSLCQVSISINYHLKQHDSTNAATCIESSLSHVSLSNSLIVERNINHPLLLNNKPCSTCFYIQGIVSVQCIHCPKACVLNLHPTIQLGEIWCNQFRLALLCRGGRRRRRRGRTCLKRPSRDQCARPG